jgi:hypothetical protein
MQNKNLLEKIKPANVQESEFLAKLKNIDLEPIMFRMVKSQDIQWTVAKAVLVAELFKAFMWLVFKYPTAVYCSYS